MRAYQIMSYFFKFISSILFAITIFLIGQNPIFSHGAKDDCSEECESYYCPEIEKKEIKDNKENNKKLKNYKNE